MHMYSSNKTIDNNVITNRKMVDYQRFSYILSCFDFFSF